MNMVRKNRHSSWYGMYKKKNISWNVGFSGPHSRYHEIFSPSYIINYSITKSKLFLYYKYYISIINHLLFKKYLLNININNSNWINILIMITYHIYIILLYNLHILLYFFTELNFSILNSILYLLKKKPHEI